MVVILQERKSRLSTLINSPGGVSVGAAVAQATANLATLKPRGMEIITAQIAELAALPDPQGPDDNVVATAYDLAASILDAAGPFGMDDLCAAASGLCNLLDAATPGEAFDWRVVSVHVQAMQLMQRLPVGEPGNPDRHKILDGLRRILVAKLHVTG